MARGRGVSSWATMGQDKCATGKSPTFFSPGIPDIVGPGPSPAAPSSGAESAEFSPAMNSADGRTWAGREGEILARAEESYELSTPQPGWAEQDPEDWWRAAERALARLGGEPTAIGLSGQMHGAVMLDEKDQVVRPALWNAPQWLTVEYLKRYK